MNKIKKHEFGLHLVQTLFHTLKVYTTPLSHY